MKVNLNKIKTHDEILNIAGDLKKQNKTIVTTNGSFDILHYAHVNLLEKTKEEGEVLIVLLNSDNSVKRFKGETRPIVPENERAKMLASLECVDYVVIFEQDEPLELLKIIKPNVHIKGGSFILERIKKEQELLSQWGGRFKNFELEEGFSTTDIIKKVLEKNDRFREN